MDVQARTNGVTTSYGYDGRGMIDLVQHTKDGHDLARAGLLAGRPGPDQGMEAGDDQTYNAMEDGRGNRYGYDAEGQLTAASYRALNPETRRPTGALRTDSFSLRCTGQPEGAEPRGQPGPMDVDGGGTTG